MELLRKKDLHPQVDAAKSTVADWIEDFHVFIPTVKRGNVTYYKPETIDVLKFIKKCREQNYHKVQIMELLAEHGFPVTVEEAVEDVKKVIEGSNARDSLITIMQTMGQAVTKIAEQDEVVKTLKNKQDGQDGRIIVLEKRMNEVDFLKHEIESLKKELAAAKEENKKGFWSRLFGK